MTKGRIVETLPRNMDAKSEIHQIFHRQMLRCGGRAEKWFQEKIRNQIPPFYSGFDIRDSSRKTAPVDANVFPAGFNNISKEDHSRVARLTKQHLINFHPNVKKILLLAEGHTNNLHYWDNALSLKTLIETAGFAVTLCVANDLPTGTKILKTAQGRTVSVKLLNSVQGDLILSNNDFSLKQDLPKEIPCVPSMKMGWNERRKHHFFNRYNRLAEEFAEVIRMAPWRLKVETEVFSPFDVTSRENLTQLKFQIARFLKKLEKNPVSEEKPYLFLKNNYGTYGLGITTVTDPEEALNWNYKTRKDLKATKGGGGVRELILQEGIPSSLREQNGAFAEPVIYTVGFHPAGGFLRIHGKKTRRENLNRPGVAYRSVPVSTWRQPGPQPSSPPTENIYQWIGRLGSLAVSEELMSA